MQIIKPPYDLNNLTDDQFKVFLAGGLKSKWREELVRYLEQMDLEHLVVIDPTVDDWQNAVGEEIASNPKFVKQTDWEQEGLRVSDYQVFNFDASTISPITLLEFGMNMSDTTLICLRDGYEKGGHIEYMARRHSLPIERSSKGIASLISIKYHLRSKV